MTAHAQDVEAVGRIDAVPTILDTCCSLTGMGFAAVARVTDERWIACSVLDKIAFGLPPGGELKLETTICHEIREARKAVVIPDVALDDIYRDHHTPAMYGFRSYISMPIILPDGRFFGTLCAIDPEPRDLGRPEIASTFTMFADLIGFHLDLADRLDQSEGRNTAMADRLASEVKAGKLREQFIAVLGHDLRNPLASIHAGVTLLERGGKPERVPTILGQMQSSVARMSALIDNVLDFARGRLGGGLPLEQEVIELKPLIDQVVREEMMSHPGRDISLDTDDCDLELRCDPGRIGQLVSNLLGNAVAHGAPEEPISVACEAQDGYLILSVTNGGEEIPAASRARLFEPFERGQHGREGEGLGLGLYIASEIAAAHGGKIKVDSSPEATCFTVSLPLEG